MHHYDVRQNFPRGDYEAAAAANYAAWDDLGALPFEFFPNVTMGWDASPRTNQNQPFENHGYPFTAVLEATPAQFQTALRQAKIWLETHPQAHQAVTINAWNEWTEGSYLEPDTRHGYGFLEAIRNVFGETVCDEQKT